MVEMTALEQYKNRSAALMLQFNELLRSAAREDYPAQKTDLYCRSAKLIEENEQVAQQISVMTTNAFNKNFQFTGL